MRHPFSIAAFAIFGILAMVLVCLFTFRAFNSAIIPASWTESGDVDSGDDASNQIPDLPRKTISVSRNIIVTSPTPNIAIGLPLVITGSARVFENTVNYRLLDADGTVLIEGNTMSNAPDVGQFGNFTITTSYAIPSGAAGIVEVFNYSAKDGAVIDLASVPIVFPTMASMTVKTYWSSLGEQKDCSSVVATERRIPKTVATGYAALTELLAGPNTKETQNTVSTSIPDGVVIKSLTIIDGIAKVQFSSGLASGGSCRVASIHAQIEATLKQFPTVTSVIISTEGKTPEESLQP